MFHRPSTRLAGLYLAILMTISLFFSVLVYQLSVQELERGLRRPEPVLQLPVNAGGLSMEIRNQIITERRELFDTAQDRIIARLIIINLLILVSGGFLSYYLALRTLKPIEEAHETQSRFTADASHELRTPITAMRSENEVALMNPKLSLKDAKQQLQSNVEELEKLSSLSDGLLRLAQLEYKDVPTDELKASSIIDEAVQRVMPLAETRKIHIIANSSTDAVVMGDATSLYESIVILLDNAIKYSPEASEVSLQTDKKQKHVTITVSDHGPGITADELPHIFDRFYRADSSRTKQVVGGYGLGLAIAKNIIEKHGGSLSANSILGSGSSFTIRLPLKN